MWVDQVSTPLIVFDPVAAPKYLLVVANGSDVLHVSRFHIPSLKLENSFSVDAPTLRFDPDLNGEISGQTLIFYGQRKDQACCFLFIIDLENGNGTAQVFLEFRHLVFVRSKKLFVSFTTRGWVQSKSLKEMEADILELSEGKGIFDGRNGEDWVLENWKRLVYIPPSFLPSYESGFAVHAKGELAYVSDFGKRLVQIAFKW